MTIKVKFFARLREQVGIGQTEVSYRPGITVSDVRAETIGDRNVGETLLVAVNMNYVKDDVALVDGDEIAFFPPVTGG